MRRSFATGRWPLIVLACASAPATASAPAHVAAGPGQRTAFCERLMDVTTEEVCADVNARMGQLPTGTGRLAPPTIVYRDNAVWVHFEVARAGAQTSLDAGEAVQTYPRIQLSRYMSAVLIGEGFRIDPAPPAGQSGGPPQPFGANGTMMWRWHVTALDAPQHNLRLEVYVHIPVKNKDGSDNYSISPVLTRRVAIPVSTTLGQRFDDAIQWVGRGTSGVERLTALLVAIGALLGAWYGLARIRRRRGQAKASAGGARGARSRHAAPAAKAPRGRAPKVSPPPDV
ncbi:MAG TPA: hypothetical protein VGW40_15430 [Allosphingosinicella sp.]|nr:hypothetical protein [Allosphingosinicella sp.]